MQQHISEKNPWQITGKQEIYDNPWIKVTEFKVLNAAGNKGIYGKIHFKHLAIGIIPLDENYNTWLVGQYRFPLNVYSWEIPEGGGKLDIEPVESAKRELLEETGLTANRWTEILTMHLSNSVSDEKGIIFIAQDVSEGQAQPDEDEVLQIKKLPFEQVFDMVMNNEITDSLAVAGILKTKILIDQGKI